MVLILSCPPGHLQLSPSLTLAFMLAMVLPGRMSIRTHVFVCWDGIS